MMLHHAQHMHCWQPQQFLVKRLPTSISYESEVYSCHLNWGNFLTQGTEEKKLTPGEVRAKKPRVESLKMVKSLLHLTSSLQEHDTTNTLTKLYRKCLKLKKEKVTLNSRQTVIRDFFHSFIVYNIDQLMDL